MLPSIHTIDPFYWITPSVYFAIGAMIGGARKHFSYDVRFIYTLTFPIHALFFFGLSHSLRVTRSILRNIRASFYQFHLESPYVEAISFLLLMFAVWYWNMNRELIESTFTRWFP